MNLKEMFEIAGVDTSSGKAKELVENNEVPGAMIPLQQFLSNYPPRAFNVHMGNYDIGHQLNRVVHNAQEFLDVVEEFADKYLTDDEVYVTQTSDPQTWSLVMEGELEEPDDFDDSEVDELGIIEVGWFEPA